eukprot:TRINITY_DN1868_c0_g1_i3.p1 TRINITY_DN1868_c0_g1~~TRINITY_DN1868_c0_g1_i3.p1  ORF type:complete len:153 (+),score=23.12 TRINITY_DN1868_c0_g1_i3:467-925(+)
MRSHWINTMKEASYLKHGDVKKMNSLTVAETQDIWEFFVNNKFDAFWKINEKLASDKDTIRYVPVRICKQDRFLQEPVLPKLENGQEETLGGVLAKQVGQYFHQTEDGSVQTTSPCKILVHGISPPLETPILWLSQNMSHSDGFLYIILLPS